MLSTVISSSLLDQIVGNLTLNLISPDSSFFFRLYKYLSHLFSSWSVHWFLLFTLGFSGKLHVREEYPISVCTEDGMLSTNETAICNISDFCWCSKRFSIYCYL